MNTFPTLPATTSTPVVLLLSILVAWAAEPAVSRLMPGVRPGWAFGLILLGLLPLFHIL